MSKVGNNSNTKSIDGIKASAKQAILKEFQKIPGVGKSISQDLYNLGYRSVKELKNLEPEEMYRNICEYQGMHVDRCMLYVFRCAVYYASNDNHDSELLKWWNWKGDLHVY